MRVFLVKSAIIGLLALLLGGCSAVRLGYNNGPQLAWWWIDGYVDFSAEQAPAARLAIDRWFEWHRPTQLPEYAAVLASAQVAVLQPTTPAAACHWQALVREKLDPGLDRALVQFADLLPGMGEAQFRHIEQRNAKHIAEMRDEYLQADPQERQKASFKRALDRAEQIYGRLDEAQRRVITAGIADSPFDPLAWVSERQARQRDTVQTLRRLAAERADADQRIAALRTLMQRQDRSPNPEYRAYQQRLTEYNCIWFAQIHNATTPAQRLRARDTLKGWEDDLRALASSPPG
jgi:hypothetical protein